MAQVWRGQCEALAMGYNIYEALATLAGPGDGSQPIAGPVPKQ